MAFIREMDRRIAYDAPRGVMTPAVLAEVMRHKLELLALLGGGGVLSEGSVADRSRPPESVRPTDHHILPAGVADQR